MELEVKTGDADGGGDGGYGRRRYNLRLVQAWLNEGRPRAARREDRVAALERQVADLAAQLAELRRTG